jgi:catechol 2,3-dioxygenase
MDMMMNMPGMGALFMSFDGYHHHIGANIWAGRTPAPADALGLDQFILTMPDPLALESAVQRLNGSGPGDSDETGILVQDPSNLRILLRS